MTCPNCKIEVKSISTATYPQDTYHKLSCGCFEPSSRIETATDILFDSLHQFQKESPSFWRKNGYRGLLADSMRLGKTVQALTITRQDWDNIVPALIVVKSRTKLIWNGEALYWLGKPKKEKWGRYYKYDINPERIPQILEATTRPLPMFNIYICSMDSLAKVTKNLQKHKIKIKTIIVDESHNFKNLGAGRTKALHDFVKQEGITQIMCLSGTPILNNALEFFPTLNLIAPHKFPSRSGFYYDWITPGEKPNTGGIKRYRHQDFFEYTKDIILRRTKEEVMAQTPQFSRIPEMVELEDDAIAKVYKNKKKELADFIEAATGHRDTVSLIAILTELRQLCGIAKIPAIVDAAKEFFENEEEVPKLLIGVHHHAVGNSLKALLAEYGAEYLIGGTSDMEASRITRRFEHDPDCKILIASTLAVGEGFDFQFIHTSFLAERQWNTYKEKQFEDRMNGLYQKWPMTCVYFMVRNSIDEWFHELVLRKMQWTESALDPEYYQKYGNESGESPSIDLWQLAEMCLR